MTAPKPRTGKPGWQDLKAGEREALATFARSHGRFWKHELNVAWSTGRDADMPHGCWLRILRNTYGPVWLTTLSVPQEAIHCEPTKEGVSG